MNKMQASLRSVEDASPQLPHITVALAYELHKLTERVKKICPRHLGLVEESEELVSPLTSHSSVP